MLPSPTTFLQRQARALGDPTRHKIFRLVADADASVGVVELAEHLGFNHNAIRQHLTKHHRRRTRRGDPGGLGATGRPPVVYEVAPAADSRWGVIGPYERLSVLLAEMVRTGEPAVDAGRRAAQRHPMPAVDAAELVDSIFWVMAREGFDPELRRRGSRVDIVLRTCPYTTTTLADPDLVCSLHLAIAEGLVERSPEVTVKELVARVPRKVQCRLRLRREPVS
jgi:predicted ArsR family transcriptional regulator